jgi:DNA-binding response OmpR family regulator
MPKHILSVSYNEPLLVTRGLLLQREGYDVTSALGFTDAVKHCKTGSFDLFILGHSIPDTDKRELVHIFSEHCKSPVLALRRHGESVPDDAEFHAYPDDIKGLLEIVGNILGKR